MGPHELLEKVVETLIIALEVPFIWLYTSFILVLYPTKRYSLYSVRMARGAGGDVDAPVAL